MREPLVGGGVLVGVVGGSGLAIEGVPDARRGLVVVSSSASRYGDQYVAGSYVLTQRAVAGSDLWRVRAASQVVDWVG